jgi:hypothetical protein
VLNLAPDFRLILDLLKWIWRFFVSPNICILEPEIGSREPVEQLVLWQIRVENRKRRLWPVSSARCTVDLEFIREGNSILKTEGPWNSDDGPVEYLELLPGGRAGVVPIIVQSTIAGPFRPGMLRQTRAQVEPGVVHVLGKDFLVGGNSHMRLDPTEHELIFSAKQC